MRRYPALCRCVLADGAAIWCHRMLPPQQESGEPITRAVLRRDPLQLTSQEPSPADDSSTAFARPARACFRFWRTVRDLSTGYVGGLGGLRGQQSVGPDDRLGR